MARWSLPPWAVTREQLVLADHERIGADLHGRVIERLFAAGMGIQSVLGRVDHPVAQRLVNVTEELDDAISEDAVDPTLGDSQAESDVT